MRHKIFRYTSAVILILFALSTLFMSSSVLFDWFGIREKEGNYVLFIVIINFIAGFLYLISAYGFIKAEKWTFWVLVITSGILIIASLALLVHINNGGIYEQKTAGAMGFRIVITIVFALIALYKIPRQSK